MAMSDDGENGRTMQKVSEEFKRRITGNERRALNWGAIAAWASLGIMLLGIWFTAASETGKLQQRVDQVERQQSTDRQVTQRQLDDIETKVEGVRKDTQQVLQQLERLNGRLQERERREALGR